MTEEVKGIIALDEAIQRFGEDEVVGGGGQALAEFRKFFPNVNVFVEEQYRADNGAPWFETLWTDITDLGGPPYPVPQVPAGDENSIVRENGRLYLVSWFD